MNLLDTASVQEDSTALREQVLIGIIVLQAHTVTGLACTWKSNVRTVMLANTAMEGILHPLQISVQKVITAQ